METVTIRVTRKFYYERELREVGTILKVPRVKALEYTGANKAEYVPEPPAPKEEPKPVMREEAPIPDMELPPLPKKEKGGKKE